MTSGRALHRLSAASKKWYFQFASTLALWCYFVALGRDNNGFWYQGDSSVHATNGLFWADFLSSAKWHPVNFALGYYARYPSISPVAYPPVFYLLEALFYHLLGVSPVVPKMLVMAFALLGTLYLAAWLRRWVSKEAGWLGVLFLMQPSIVVWGHAVMLNVPCTALGIAALYHWRRWLDDARSQHVWWASAFGALAVFTYIPMLVIVLVMIGWTIFAGRTRQLVDRRLILPCLIAGLSLLLWMKVAGRWDAGYQEVSLYLGAYPAWKLSAWTYYILRIPYLVSIPIASFAVVGIVLSLFQWRWSEEIVLALSWFFLSYLWFSLFSVKEPRYVLLLVAPLIIMAVVGMVELVRLVGGSRLPVIMPVFALMITFHIWLAARVPIPKVGGFFQIAAYMRSLDPTAWVLYDGNYGQLFTLFYRMEDPNFSGGVVRTDKLLYAGKISFEIQQNVSSVADVARLLTYECGCKYVLVERSMPRTIAAERYFSEVLHDGSFQFLQSFPVETPSVKVVDLYEYEGTLVHPAMLRFKFPIVGDHVELAVKPLARRK